MSDNLQHQQIEDIDDAEYINLAEVDEEIQVSDDLPVPNESEFQEDKPEEQQPLEIAPADEQPDIEIDMSNNSIAYFDKHSDSIFCVSHHPKLPLVCSGGADNVAYLWTSHSVPPKFAQSIEHSESVIACAFTSQQGKYLITCDMNGICKVSKSSKDGSRWKNIGELQQCDEIVWMKTHPTIESIFAFGGIDGSVWCYSIEESTDELVLLMSGFAHQQDCSMGDFLPSIQNDTNNPSPVQLVTCSIDGTIVVWNCYTGDIIHKWTSSDFKGLECPWISLSCFTKNIACVGSNNGCLTVINCTSGHVLHLNPCVITLKPEEEESNASIESIAWCTSGGMPLLCVGLVRGDVLLYETTSMRLRSSVTLPDSATKILFRDLDIFISCINGNVYKYDARKFHEPTFTCVGHNTGVLDFCFAGKDKIVTAGDEGVSLIFKC
ncbi:Sqt1p SCDLUD_002473 [Saccharomycodes ludwigii]|uniref:Sqt1p n=1 Tax=Saccharomycodes ludwigii TaxID=36035 RepID=UPI001E875BD8|nr:hypothetical protein SCDLUD_002473 [Saccharomycodes ludwigii]KAH3901008.1 hypothetical protein SCDLUD_002473 [Saccharomycodes ludwigii]